MSKLPFKEDDKPEVRIEGWEIYGNVIWGKAFGHSRFDDGTSVRTSSIVDMPSNPKKGDTVETLNTRYVLGDRYAPATDGEG